MTREIVAFGYANDRLWITEKDEIVLVCVGHEWASLPIAHGGKTEYLSSHTEEQVIDRILEVLLEQTDPIVRGYIERSLCASARYAVCISTSGTINLTVEADGQSDAAEKALWIAKDKRYPEYLVQHMNVSYVKRIGE